MPTTASVAVPDDRYLGSNRSRIAPDPDPDLVPDAMYTVTVFA